MTAGFLTVISLTGGADVRAADSSGAESGGTQTVRHEKYVEDKQDGTYDLTLTIAGAVGSETSKAKLDVIYVLDKSGSMNYNMNDDHGSQGRRREAAGNAINSLTNALAGNENLDVRFSLVTFSGSNQNDRPWDDADTAVNWTENASAVTQESKPSSGGGTNYQAGIVQAKTLLDSKRSGAMTAVIFVSDGDPTFRYDGKGHTQGNGSSDSGNENLNAAKTEAGTLSSDYFFTVGVGPSGNYGKLRTLKDAAALVHAENREFYEGTDETALNAAFDDIKASIIKLLCTNVTVTDVLSRNVQLVTGTDGEAKAFTLRVKDADGNVVASGENRLVYDHAEITARYDEQARKLVMDFPDDYELKEGYTYLVTVNIEAAEAAYETYRANGNAYPDTGGRGTGATSEGKAGVYANDAANVTYAYNGKNYDEPYEKPVIQLHPGTLVIEKKILGLENDPAALAALKEKLTFAYSLNDKEIKTVSISEFTFHDETKTFSYVINGLSPNTTYKVREEHAELFPEHAYNLKTTEENTEGRIGRDEAQTAVFQNQYSPSKRMLTIEKKVTGNMGDKNQRFAFHLVVENVGTYTFYLKDGETKTFELPYGCTYRLEEENLDYKVSVDGKAANTVTGSLKEDKKITYVNTKNVAAPTGIHKSVMPYLIMTGAAMVMAVIFILCRKRDC